jgi:hypothetical protein
MGREKESKKKATRPGIEQYAQQNPVILLSSTIGPVNNMLLGGTSGELTRYTMIEESDTGRGGGFRKIHSFPELDCGVILVIRAM